MTNEIKHDVFVSYRREDREEVTALIETLQFDFDLEVWIDSKLTPGNSFTSEIEEAINSSNGAIICLKSPPDGFHKREIDLLINKNTSTNGAFVIYPVILPSADERLLKDNFLSTYQFTDLRRGLRDIPQLRKLAKYLKKNRLVPVHQAAGPNTAYPEYSLPKGYSADVQKITELLIGTSLYSYRDVCIRELIQNAFDACERRKGSGLQYQPSITVRVNTSEGWFEVDDTGEGMNEKHLANSFSIIGKSIGQEDDIVKRTLANEKERLHLTAKFGIGFISTFILSDRVSISTKSEGYRQINFDIEGVASAFEYYGTSKIHRDTNQIGTTIRVYLKKIYQSGDKAIDIVSVIRRFCRHVPYLKVTKNDQEISIVDDWNIRSNEVVLANVIRHFYECKLSFSSTKRGVIASNQGFFLEKNPDAILPAFCPDILSGEINFFPGVVEPNVARDKIVYNDLSEKIADQVAKEINALFKREQSFQVNKASAPSRGANDESPYESLSESDSLRAYSDRSSDRSAILYHAMNFLKISTNGYRSESARLDPILNAVEASEFILDYWIVSVPKQGAVQFRKGLEYIRAHRDNRVYYQTPTFSGEGSPAQMIFRDSFIARGDIVISSQARDIQYLSDKKVYKVSEAEVLHILASRYQFLAEDISAPNDDDLRNLIIDWSDIHPKLVACAERVHNMHGVKIRFIGIPKCPAAFTHKRFHYVNLHDIGLARMAVRVDQLESDTLFAFICGLVQRMPF